MTEERWSEQHLAAKSGRTSGISVMISGWRARLDLDDDLVSLNPPNEVDFEVRVDDEPTNDDSTTGSSPPN